MQDKTSRIPENKTVMTKLPREEYVSFEKLCSLENKTINKKLREMINRDINSPKKTFLSGQNKIKYDKTSNAFSWFVELDSGEVINVLNNISDHYLKNLNQQIQEAIKERNQWVHQTKSNSVDVPGDLTGELK